jgi:hypothetical protein
MQVAKIIVNIHESLIHGRGPSCLETQGIQVRNHETFTFANSSCRYYKVWVAVQCKTWNVSTRSNTGIAVSNPDRGMDVCVLCLCGTVRVAALRRADYLCKESELI